MGKTLWALALISVFFGFGETVFAQDGANGSIQKGLIAQNLGNYGEAFQWFQRAADAGNADGQYHLGYLYLSGQGVTSDASQAVKCFRMGAAQGNARCEFYLGSCYENGWGVSKDLDEAKKWYQSASQQGFNGAENSLNRLNEIPPAPTGNGSSVPPQPGSVAPSEGDDPDAWVKQGMAELQKKNASGAVSFFRKAANAGNSEGEAELGACYLQGIGIPQDNNLGAKWARKSADAGNARGQVLMGALYKDGVGVKKDSHEEVRWLQKAVDQGSPEGQFYLGACYVTGEGVPKDLKKAKDLFQKSADQGFPPAQKVLTAIVQGKPVPKTN